MNKIVLRNNPTNMSPFGFNFPTLFSGDIFRDFDKLLGDVFDVQHQNMSLRKGFPKGDVYLDEDKNAVIELALAGYSKDQLSVAVEDNKLVISAEKQEESESQGRSLARRAFRKEFHNVAGEWNLAQSEVSYKDGLLRVVVPRAVHEQPEAIKLEIK